MENLKILEINNQGITIKEFKGQRVITFKDIDTVHQRAEGTANRNFRENKDKFIENEDYFFVKPKDIQTDEIRRSEINNSGTYLITESGYLMLVKSFTDDLAWKVQRQLVNSYFKERVNTDNTSLVSCNLKIYKVEQRVDNLENCMTIDYEQQNELRLLGNKVAVKILGGYESPAYKEMGKKIFYRLWKDYKIYFKVNSYRNTPRIKYLEAQEYILNWQPDTNTRITIKNLNISSQQVLEVGELA